MELQFENGSRTLDPQQVLGLIHESDPSRVILGGTLVEGTGNSQSDLDVYVICERKPTYGEIKHHPHALFNNDKFMQCTCDDESVRQTIDFHHNSPMNVEIEYITLKEIDDLKNRIVSRFDYVASQADVTTFSPFSGSDVGERSLHKIIHGRYIDTGLFVGDSVFGADVRQKYNFITFRQHGWFFWVFKDVVGAIQSRNDFMILETTRDYLISQLIALYSLSGVTNTRKRWFPKYVQTLSPEEFGDVPEKVLNVLFGDFGTRQRRLHFPDLVFPVLDELANLTRLLLDGNSIFPSCRTTLELLEHERTARLSSNPGLATERLFQVEFEFRKGVLTGAPFFHADFVESIVPWK